ncbi:MAG: hypothetical protein ABW047_03770 [Nitrospiraceae bacterium]
MLNTRSLRSLLLSTLLAGCSAQTDAVSQHINACLLVTEAEVEIAIGTPVTAPEKRSNTQCLYHAKANPDDTVVVEIDQNTGKQKKGQFNDERLKTKGTLISGIGDGAFTLPSPLGGIQLTFMKGDALVTLTLTSARHGTPFEALTNLAKSAAHRLAAQLPLGDVSPEAVAAALPAPKWTGDWYGCIPIGLLNAKGHLSLTDSGDWSLTTAVIAPGMLTATRGHWQVDSFQDILHGTYQLAGKEIFSTTGILNVKWNRVPKGQSPTRFDATLYKSLTGIPHKIAVKRLPPVEPGMVGTWEGSARFVDHQEEFVWTITPGNVSEFYKSVLWTGRIEHDGDSLRLVVVPTKTAPFQFKVVNGEALDLTDSEGTVSQWNRKHSRLARC